MTKHNHKYDIRVVAVDQIKVLQAISEATFLESFAHLNTAENIKLYTQKAFTEHAIEQELNEPNSCFFFIYSEEQVAGYLKLNIGEAQTDRLLDNALEIERIYVLSAFHGKGLGKALFQHAVRIAKDKAMDWVWLGVWEENIKAIEFNRRQGLAAFPTHAFYLGHERQTDVLMKRAL